MKNIILALILCTTVVTGANAQKFGYVNTAVLLSELPEVQAADTQLEAYQSQLVAEGQAKVRLFEQNYQAFMAEANSGEFSKVQMAQKEQSLQAEQQAIQAFEQEVQDLIMAKRQELLSPILQKVDIAIQALGKEGGYTFIFDLSAQGAMLYAPDSDDITELVKAKIAE